MGVEQAGWRKNWYCQVQVFWLRLGFLTDVREDTVKGLQAPHSGFAIISKNVVDIRKVSGWPITVLYLFQHILFAFSLV